MIQWKRAMIAMMLAAALAATTACAAAPASNESTSEAAGVSSASSTAQSTGEQESVSESASASESTQTANIGFFTAETLDGEAVDETIFSGHTLTVVNVWATFCGWCVDEMPILSALNDEYAEKGVQVVGIVNDTIAADGSEDPEQVALAKDIVAQGNATYTQLKLSDDLIQLGFASLPAVPATFFFDGNGNLVGQGFLGAKNESQWRETFDTYLKMAEEQMGESAA